MLLLYFASKKKQLSQLSGLQLKIQKFAGTVGQE